MSIYTESHTRNTDTTSTLLQKPQNLHSSEQNLKKFFNWKSC